MSESIYIKETNEFLLENGTIIKKDDLTKEEIDELMLNTSKVNRLFGKVESNTDRILRG